MRRDGENRSGQYAHCGPRDPRGVPAEAEEIPRPGLRQLLGTPDDGAPGVRAAELADRYPFLYAAVGWHPENCGPYTPAGLEEIRALAQHPRVRAIGEIGLDYYQTA